MARRKQELDEGLEEIRPKKNKGMFTYMSVIILIIIIFGALLVALKNVDLIKFDNPISNTGKATINYTTTNTKVKEGTYIIDVSEVVEEVMPSIVAITSKTLVSNGMFGPSWFYNNENTKRYQEGAGSGIIISKNDKELLILTNNHVVEGAEELSVQFVNGKNLDAKIKGTSEKKDVAVISVDLSKLDNATAESIKIATLGDSSKLKVGNGIIAIGNALGYGQSVTTGVVSALNREISDTSTKMIQIDAAINGGNSGGALINSVGEVVGINSAKYSSSSSTQASIEGMGFAIPITDVKELIEKLMNGEADDTDAAIGIEGYMIDETQSTYYNMPIGFYISKINENSGADKADLEIGNIITKINGKEVESVDTIKTEIEGKKKGDKVKLTISYVSRNQYKEKTVEVTLS